MKNKQSRGSALVMTMALAGILVFAVAAMLYAARNTVRSSRDKLDYETTFHTGLAGLQMAKSWMFAPATAKTMFDNGDAVRSDVEGMTSCAVQLSKDIMTTNSIADSVTASNMLTSYYTGKNGFTAVGTNLADGRKVIYNFPRKDGKVIGFSNDVMSTPTNSITKAPGELSYVSRLRVTTPYLSGTNRDQLKNVSLVLEAEAVTKSTGATKTRWIQEKVLIYPQMAGRAEQAYVPAVPGVPAPTASSGAAIIGGGGVSFAGNSHSNVAWGPTWAKGDLKLLNLGFTPAGVDKKGNPTDPGFTAGNKLFISGAADPFNVTDKWTKWQAGTGGFLKNDAGNMIFPTSIFTGSYAVVDYMSQAWNHTFDSLSTGYYPGNNKYGMTGFGVGLASATGSPAAPTSNGATSIFGVYSDSPAYGQTLRPEGGGFLVQNSPVITARVNDMIDNILGYTAWKNFAISRGRYFRPPTNGGSQFVNDQNQPLYVKNDPNNPNLKVLTTNSQGATAFTQLGQLSMINLVPGNGNIDTNPFAAGYVLDQILFLDTPEGTKNGTMRDYNINSSDHFFFKGLMYVNGNLDTQGGGSFPSIRGKNPDEYATDAYGTTTGHMIDQCYLDGILFVRGKMSKTGNAAVYGTLVSVGQGATNAVDGAGSPDLFYNTRNKFGLFKGDPSSNGTPETPYQAAIKASTFNVVGGATHEMPVWPPNAG
jgi:hypothetical protein